MFTVPTVSLVASTSFDFEYSLITVQMQAALIQKIFVKTFQFPVIRSSFYKLGDMLNMVQVDTLQIVGYYKFLSQTIILPFFLVFAIFVSYTLIGNKCVIGLGFALL